MHTSPFRFFRTLALLARMFGGPALGLALSLALTALPLLTSFPAVPSLSSRHTPPPAILLGAATVQIDRQNTRGTLPDTGGQHHDALAFPCPLPPRSAAPLCSAPHESIFHASLFANFPKLYPLPPPLLG